MNHLQKKIAHLDAENHTSRRRMKELEGELDVCRRDVEKQRELVIHREALIGRQQRAEGATTRSKGKARAVEDTDEEKKRYIQAVQEKKGSQLYNIHPLLHQTDSYSFGISYYYSPVSHVPAHL
jgi:hypothetical protein